MEKPKYVVEQYGFYWSVAQTVDNVTLCVENTRNVEAKKKELEGYWYTLTPEERLKILERKRRNTAKLGGYHGV